MVALGLHTDPRGDTLMATRTVLTIFGTRPEVIKLAPVVRALEQRSGAWRCVNVSTSQHTDLLRPFLGLLGVTVHHDLAVMRDNQTPTAVLARALHGLEALVQQERPDVIVVQGDTTTALAGALAGFYARVPVAHVEAGLRSGDLASPFPEEAHRRQIGVLAHLHLAATPANRATLQGEGVATEQVVLAGNPVVDSLQWMAQRAQPSHSLARLLHRVREQRLVVLTTHRRENFGATMRAHLRAVRQFAAEQADVVVVFPVHPNPQVQQAAREVLGGAERVHLIEPLDYSDFVCLLRQAWLVCSDSGGIQEEAPSLRVPVLILRDTTERPEVVHAGVGRLVGHSGEHLLALLRETHADSAWHQAVQRAVNPFGDGLAGERIAQELTQRYALPAQQVAA